MTLPAHLSMTAPTIRQDEMLAALRNAPISAIRGITHYYTPRACFTDAGGTTVLTDGQEILRANDQIGAVNATATATNGLVYVANMWNGFPGWRSNDTSNDKLTATNALASGYGNASFYVVISMPTQNADTVVAIGGSDWYLLKTAETMGANLGDLTDAQTDLPEIISNFGVLWVTYDGTTRRVGFNGHYLDEAASGTLAPGADLLIGALGAGDFGNDDAFGEVVTCNVAHTIDESKAVVSQLLNLYGIHSTLTCDGNSLMMGTGSEALTKHGTCVGAQLQALLPQTVFANYGIGGQTTTNMNSDRDATTLKTVMPLSDKNICFLWEATNEIEAGTSAASTYANLVTYAAAMQAVGFKVIVGTVLDRDWASDDAAKDAVRLQVNSMIRAQGLDDFDGIVDFETVPELTDCSDTDYFQTDAIHLNEDGAGLAAAKIAAVFEQVRRRA